jgi:hypothetical protein
MATQADWRVYMDLAKSEDILRVAQDIGCKLKKAATAEWVGPCPIDGGTDRFSVNTRKQVFNCRGGDDGGGDIIKMVRHCLGCSVREACEHITGRPAPDSSRDESMEERAARIRENASRMEASRIRAEQEREVERIKVRKDEEAVSVIIDRAVAIEGTLAEAYLRSRGLVPNKRLTVDLRFVADLDYWGIPDNGTTNSIRLATLPALIAIIRNYHGDIIGISQTFLDPDRPAKWRPTGSIRNSAKKVRGSKRGGMVRLGRMTETLAIGEGWENPLAWHQLGGGLHLEDMSLAGAVDIGNLCGQSLGKTPHPFAVDADGARIRMPSGAPDLDNPGVIIPDGVKTVIIIADANSDQFRTAAHYVTGGNRFQHHGLKVGIAWPPPGYDWNDILVRELEAAKADAK